MASGSPLTCWMLHKHHHSPRSVESSRNRYKADKGKARYSAAFLFIASACFAKLSLVIFLRNLTPIVFDHRAGLYVGGGIILWALTAILGTAFQCHLPKPWDYLENSCFNRVSLTCVVPGTGWYLTYFIQTSWEHYVAIMNILTDVSLVVLPMIIVGRLKAPRKKKAILLLTFMGRIWYNSIYIPPALFD